MTTQVSLNEVMDFDHVIRVNEDASITDSGLGQYAPSVTMVVDADGQDVYGDEYLQEQAQAEGGWKLVKGFSGQSGCGVSYTGPVMHSSEYVGGGLADYIVNTPGYWVVISVEAETEDGEREDTPAGWAIAYKEV